MKYVNSGLQSCLKHLEVKQDHHTFRMPAFFESLAIPLYRFHADGSILSHFLGKLETNIFEVVFVGSAYVDMGVHDDILNLSSLNRQIIISVLKTPSRHLPWGVFSAYYTLLFRSIRTAQAV